MRITLETLQQRPLSFSSLSKFAISPLHYCSYLTEPKVETPALILGRAFHAAILQPVEFHKKYAVMPEADGRTKEGREIKTAFAIEHTGKTFLTPDQSELVNNMANAINSHDHAPELIKQCSDFEKQVRFTYKGLPFISYIDGLSPVNILELKTTERADDKSFSRDAFNYNYPLQAAIYSKATAMETVKYIVIEKNLPYAINVFNASEEYLEYGMKQLDRLCEEFHSCMEYNRFGESYEYFRFSKETSLELPAWALKQV